MSDEARAQEEALVQAMDDDDILADIYWLSESSTGMDTAYRLKPIVRAILAALEGWRLVSVEMERATMDLGAQHERERLRLAVATLEDPWPVDGAKADGDGWCRVRDVLDLLAETTP